MRKNVTVIEVLVSSPNDLKTSCEKCLQVITQWNLTQGTDRSIFLEAILWKSHAPSEDEGRHQDIVDRSDMAIVLFNTRLGTPTGEADSGTVKEIERLAKSEKTILVYFCTANCSPERIDPEPLSKLKQFNSKLRKHTLIRKFDTDDELLSLLNRDIGNVINNLSSGNIIPKSIQSYLHLYPEFSIPSEIKAQFVHTTRPSFFFGCKRDSQRSQAWRDI